MILDFLRLCRSVLVAASGPHGAVSKIADIPCLVCEALVLVFAREIIVVTSLSLHLSGIQPGKTSERFCFQSTADIHHVGPVGDFKGSMSKCAPLSGWGCFAMPSFLANVAAFP
ncbi:unnamed protein product [Amoebophrya sp. A25]|nr:unnamed protein product [Amoebophrya sp. A25]|eukprot:GSA25T00000455001.1